jgi:hypothetical protein
VNTAPGYVFAKLFWKPTPLLVVPNQVIINVSAASNFDENISLENHRKRALSASPYPDLDLNHSDKMSTSSVKGAFLDSLLNKKMLSYQAL